jgi:hypothetical protein
MDVVSQRLLAIDGLAEPKCGQRCKSVRVFGRADDNSVDVAGRFVELSEVGVSTSLRVLLGGQSKIAGIHIAKSDDVHFARASDCSQVRSASPADSDEGDVDLIVG